MTTTIPRLFLHLTDTFQKPGLLLYKKDGRYLSLSTAEVRQEVERIALGLRDLGVGRGDNVILLAENSPWWVMMDYAILGLGAITVPIYPSLVSDQIKYIISDSDSKVVIVSDRKLWDKVAEIRGDLTGIRHFISFEERPAASMLSLAELKAKGEKSRQAEPSLFKDAALSVKPDDLASIIYTSGTTGVPKGVMLTHANFISNVKTLATIIPFSDRDTDLSFLPLSHVLERMVTFTFMSGGLAMAYAESVETVAGNLLEVRPHIMVSVPRRLREDLRQGHGQRAGRARPCKKKIFFWASRSGKEYGDASLRRSRFPAALQRRRDRPQARLLQDHRQDRRPGPLFRLRRSAPVQGHRRVLLCHGTRHPGGLRPDRDLAGDLRQHFR